MTMSTARFVFVVLLAARSWYARWALRYVPPLIDGAPNPDFDQLNGWANDRRVTRFIKHGSTEK